ncbi:MAG: hypothetical protein RRB13_15905 [bacterium]|nr:hypothetical protein [bacterium]
MSISLILKEVREVREELRRLSPSASDASPDDLRELVLRTLGHLEQLFARQHEQEGGSTLIEGLSEVISKAQISVSRLRP